MELSTLPPPTPSRSTSAVPSDATTGAASLALSADLLRLLNMSWLETGSLLMDNDPAGVGGAGGSQSDERQYIWLERYHAHIAAQQREQQEQQAPASLTTPTLQPQTTTTPGDDNQPHVSYNIV